MFKNLVVKTSKQANIFTQAQQLLMRPQFAFSAAAAAQTTPAPVDRKVWKNAYEATHDVKDGDTLLAGGFGLCGIPENLIKAVAKREVKDLTLVSNECGTNDYGLSLLLRKH